MARGRAGRGRWSRRVGRSGGLGGLLSALALVPVASRAPLYLRLIVALMRDGRVPTSRKALLGIGVAYLLLGRDLVPDRIPVLGGLDDALVAVLVVDLFLAGVPEGTLHETLDRLGIERSRFDGDVENVRRLLPRPLRRAIHRVAASTDLGGRALGGASLGPRLRTWLKEDGLS